MNNKTAMGELIKMLEKANNEYHLKYNQTKGKEKQKWDNAMSVQTIAVINAKKILEKEKQQILDSYTAGYTAHSENKQCQNLTYFDKTYSA